MSQVPMGQSRELDNPKILIADDDEASRILLRAAITPWGYEVVEARDGEEAWEILQQPNPPQILILDWLMPRLDGIALCKRIENELNFHPYTVFVTRMAGTENVIQGLEAGADEFIIKPFDVAELRIRVFAGERIIKYRNQLTKQNKLLQSYSSNMKKLAEEYARQLLPFTDMGAVLEDIQRNLHRVIAKLNENQPIDNISIAILQDQEQKIQALSTTIKNFQKSGPQEFTSAVALTPKETLIDMERMNAFFGTDINAIKDFIKTFIALSSKQIGEIEKAIQTKDIKAGKYYFHLLGSASGNSGIKKMYELCGEGEKKVVEGDWQTAQADYEGLKLAIKALQKEIDELKM